MRQGTGDLVLSARPLAHVQPHAGVGHLDDAPRGFGRRRVGRRVPLRLRRDGPLKLGRGDAVHRQTAGLLVVPDRLLGQRQVVAADVAVKEPQRLKVALQLLDRLAGGAVLKRFGRLGLAADRLAARAVQALAQRVRGDRRARIVEGENVPGAHAVRAGHLLRAPLAHAHAVAEAPEADQKAIRLLLHPDGLVARGIDRQGEHVLHPAKSLEVDRGLRAPGAVGRGQRKPQHGIHPAGRGVFGRVGLHRRDLNDLPPARPQTGRRQLIGRRREQRLGQFGVQRAVFARSAGNQRAVCAAGGVFQVVGIVLDHQIGHRAAPDVGAALGLAAVARGVKALRIGARGGGQALTPGRVDRTDHVGLAGRIAKEHLAVRIVGHVVAARGLLGTQGVGARGDGLRLERLQRVAVGHFVAYHAVEIGLDVHPGHRLNAVARREDQVGMKGVGLGGRGELHPTGKATRKAVERDLRAGGHRLAVHRERQRGAAQGDVHRRAGGNGLARAGVGAAGLERDAAQAAAQLGQLDADHAVARRQGLVGAHGERHRQHQHGEQAANQLPPQSFGVVVRSVVHRRSTSFVFCARFFRVPPGAFSPEGVSFVSSRIRRFKGYKSPFPSPIVSTSFRNLLLENVISKYFRHKFEITVRRTGISLPPG